MQRKKAQSSFARFGRNSTFGGNKKYMFVSCRKSAAVYIFWLQFLASTNFLEIFFRFFATVGWRDLSWVRGIPKTCVLPSKCRFLAEKGNIQPPNWDALAGLRPAKHIPMPTPTPSPKVAKNWKKFQNSLFSPKKCSQKMQSSQIFFRQLSKILPFSPRIDFLRGKAGVKTCVWGTPAPRGLQPPKTGDIRRKSYSQQVYSATFFGSLQKSVKSPSLATIQVSYSAKNYIARPHF